MEGISVDEMTPDIASELRLPLGTKGVVVTQIDPASPAAEAGLRRGDVIQEVSRKPVRTIGEFEMAAHKAGKQRVLLLVNREGNTIYVVLGSQ